MTQWPPDVVLGIAEALEDDPTSLAAAIQVNRTWFREGIKVLWRDPPPDALASGDRASRSEYALNVQRLYFCDEGRYHAALKDLRFPRLERVWIEHDSDMVELDVGQYLQPSLTEFYMLSDHVEPQQDIFDTMAVRCQNLRCLMINYPKQGERVKAFRRVIQQCAHLEKVQFCQSSADLFTREVLVDLASHPKFMELDVCCLTPDTELLDQVIMDGVLQNLKRVQLSVPERVLRPLVSALKSVEDLDLKVNSGDSNGVSVLSTISNERNMEKLKILSLVFSCDNIPRDEILSLKHLGALRELHIRPFEDERFLPIEGKTLHCLDLQDEDFKLVMRSLSHLQELTFQIECRLSARCLETMSSRLTYLHLLESIHLPELMRNEPSTSTWPALEHLDLGELPLEDRSAEDYMRCISGLFPNLKTLQLGQGHEEFSEAVEEAFKVSKRSSKQSSDTQDTSRTTDLRANVVRD